MTASPVAGWYLDPEDTTNSTMRYWDGAAWGPRTSTPLPAEPSLPEAPAPVEPSEPDSVAARADAEPYVEPEPAEPSRSRRRFLVPLAVLVVLLGSLFAFLALSPSHTGAASSSSLAADQATALNVSRNAYYDAQSRNPPGLVTVGSPTSNDVTQIASQISVNGYAGAVSAATGGRGGAWFAFADGNAVCVSLQAYPVLSPATSRATC